MSQATSPDDLQPPLQTTLLQVDPQTPDPAALTHAAEILAKGGLVAFPTETVYGLGAHALDAQAVSRIFAAKGRPTTDPLIVHIAAAEQLSTLAENLPPLAHTLAAHFWPGPLTLVVQRQAHVPSNVSAGRATVAVRVPQHPVALALLRIAKLPIAAPSANLFTRPSPTTAQHVLDDLRGRIEMVVDGGPTQIGIESTVLDLTSAQPTVLRPGGVTLEQLQALIPDLVFQPAYIGMAEQQAAASPGMLLKHYSPHANVLLFAGPVGAVVQAMQQRAAALVAAGQRVGILVPDEEAEHFARITPHLVRLGSHHDLAQVSAALFAGLRTLDQQGVDVLLVRAFERVGLGLALWDRLFRAAEAQVITIDE